MPVICSAAVLSLPARDVQLHCCTPSLALLEASVKCRSSVVMANMIESECILSSAVSAPWGK